MQSEFKNAQKNYSIDDPRLLQCYRKYGILIRYRDTLCYELLSDYARAHKNQVEYHLWKSVHYKLIEEYRKLLKQVEWIY
jgi:hypothetical protein